MRMRRQARGRAPVWFQLQAHPAAAADVACTASTQAGGECKAGQAAGQGSSASTNQGAQRGTQQQQQDKAHAALKAKGDVHQFVSYNIRVYRHE